MSPRASAVIVNFNQQELLRQCLQSLATALDHAGETHETVVVDNASSDGSLEVVRNEFPDVRLIQLPENRGFAGGVAEGIRAARGEWVFCINNDAIVERDAVAQLLRVVNEADDDLGSVAALMVFADRPDIINSAGIEVDRLGVASDRLLGEPVAASEQEVVEVFGASAGAALYRRAMLEEVPFDESFFAYLEDVDVAWRARMCGWTCLYTPHAVVRHHHSATARHGSAFKYYWSGRNRVRVLARNATASQLRRYGLAMFFFETAYIAAVLVVDHSAAPIRGRFDGLRTWRVDRDRVAASRRSIALSPFLGFRSAFRRFRGGPRARAHVRTHIED